MAGSALAIIQEKIRRGVADDDKFIANLLYFFELRVPASQMGGAGSLSFFFPLVINPQSYSMTEPFALEKTITQGAGLYVEEHGIIERMIRLQGTTGFKPRKLPFGVTASSLRMLKPEQKSFSRALQTPVVVAISGQRHFQYLQDAVFRTYADLKRDPATAEDTQLLFHNPKDGEAWLVAPQTFTLERSSDKPVSYNYSIELLVLGPQALARQYASEDKSLLDSLKNVIQTVKSGIALMSGALNDLTALTAELSGLVRGIASTLDTCRGVITAAQDYVNGVTSFIQSPYAVISSLQEIIDANISLLGTIESFPDTVLQTLATMGDGLDLLGMHPAAFAQDTVALMADLKKRQELLLSSSQDALQAASASSSPTTLAGMSHLGTAMTPGEVLSAGGETQVGREIPQYTGAQQCTIGAGDTLTSLAARYLGDARLWQNIAILNGLKPPFTNAQASADLSNLNQSPLPGSVGVGRKILVPSFAKPPEAQTLLPVLGVSLDASAEEHFLGADFELVATTKASGRTTYDIRIDTDGGSHDAKIIRGIPNLTQGLKLRLAVERGTDILYKSLGLDQVVSLSMTAVDEEMAKFRILEAIHADARVAAVRSLSFTVQDATPDALEADIEVEVRGFVQTNVLQASLPSQ